MLIIMLIIIMIIIIIIMIIPSRESRRHRPRSLAFSSRTRPVN